MILLSNPYLSWELLRIFVGPWTWQENVPGNDGEKVKARKRRVKAGSDDDE